MGRAGFEIWFAHDWGGSYEESPPNILDELKRDRRWCQGNLQHLRLLFGDGIRWGHRAIMTMGVMTYASALLSAIFLVFSSAEVIIQSAMEPVYFSPRPSLFPLWPIWHPELTIALIDHDGCPVSFAQIVELRADCHVARKRRLWRPMAVIVGYRARNCFFHPDGTAPTLVSLQICRAYFAWPSDQMERADTQQ